MELLEDLLQEEVHLVDCLDSWGRGPIHAAAITSDSKCLQMLINAGANVNLRCGPRGDYKVFFCLFYILKINLIIILFYFFFQIKTALHLSGEHGHDRNVSVLLEAGASFVSKDSNGLTPLDLADRAGHKICMNMLREAAGTFIFIFSFYCVILILCVAYKNVFTVLNNV